MVLFVFIFVVTPYFHEVLGGSRTTAYLVAVASVLSFFASLILHELGHALVARRNGLTVAGIDLWAFGGITRTTESQSPGMEFRVAAAGPLVTLAVIVVCVLAGRLLADSGHFFDVAVGAEGGARDTGARVAELGGDDQRARARVQPDPRLPPGRRAGSPTPRSGGAPAIATAPRTPPDARDRPSRCCSASSGCGPSQPAARSGCSRMLIAFFLYQAAGAAVAQGSLGRRIQNITVADIMDREPVTIPAGLNLLDAQEQFFLRYRWPWFAVVDPARHFLGVVRGQRVDDEISAGRPALPVAEVLEQDLPVRIGEEAPLESLLGAEGLSRLGAMVAVDEDGVLQGVVTLAQVRRALRAGRRYRVPRRDSPGGAR